jgi:hypothetical protein
MEMDSGRALLREILKRACDLPEGSSLRDLYMSSRGLAAIDTMDDLQRPVSDLAERGCLRLVERPTTGGRPPSPMVEIHPNLRADPRNSRKSRKRGAECPREETSATIAMVYAPEEEDPRPAPTWAKAMDE